MKKIIGLILVLAVVFSACSFALITSAAPDESSETIEVETSAEKVADYVAQKKDVIEADLNALFVHFGLDAVCKISPVKDKEEVNIEIVLNGVAKEDKEKKAKIVEVLASGNMDALKMDFGFLTNAKNGCPEIKKVNIIFYDKDTLKKDGTIDLSDAKASKITEIVLAY